MKISRAIVTGASGGLGALLIEELKGRGFETSNFSFVRQSSLEFEAIVQEFQPDVVFHAAALVKSNRLADYSINTEMIWKIAGGLEKLPPANRPALVSYGSAAELGVVPEEKLPISEQYICRPVTPYGASKLQQSLLALSLGEMIGFRVLVPRIFNILYLKGPFKSLLGNWLDQLVTQKDDKRVVLKTGNLNISRDFVDPVNATSAIVDLVENESASGIVNIGSGKEVFLSEVVQTLGSLVEKELQIQLDPVLDKQVQSMRIVCDAKRLQGLIGRDLKFDLRSLVKTYLENHR